MPKTSVLAAWAEAVPADFRFVLKASRRITHQAKLVNVAESCGYLARGAEVLESKLGAVLFQLPGYLRKDIERLRSFLDVWPKALPAAIEFRHDSWIDDETHDLLTQRNVALCVSHESGDPPACLATTGWAYLRLRGERYSTTQLARWQRGCAEQTVARKNETGASADDYQGFAFFKHEDAGAGPKLAQKFLQLTSKPEPKRARRAKAKQRQSRE